MDEDRAAIGGMDDGAQSRAAGWTSEGPGRAATGSPGGSGGMSSPGGTDGTAGALSADEDALGPGAVAAVDVHDMAGAIAAQADHVESGWVSAWEATRTIVGREPADTLGVGAPAGASAASDALSDASAASGAPSGLPMEAGALPGPSAAARIDGVVACGMGGSAIGADFVLAALPSLEVPFAVVRGYEPPGWMGPRTLVIAVSYSGNTEETLACARVALGRGARLAVVTGGGALAELALEHDLPRVPLPGGLQPRAAVGFLTTAVAAVLARAGLAPDIGEQVGETAALLGVMAAELGPEVPEPYNPAKALARRMRGRLPVVYGAGVTAVSARRWKTQLNENGKSPAAFVELPELCHNEIVGWEGDPDLLARSHVVVLRDPLEDPRVERRIEPALEGAHRRAGGVDQIVARGISPLARAVSAAYLGDWVSLYLAVLAGVDPTPVRAIEDLKRRLAQLPPA